MKRSLALFCAVSLAFLCFACGETKPTEPTSGQENAAALLTLHTDTQPLRIVTQEKDVKVTLQRLEYEPTIGFLRPIADEWEKTLEPGKAYEIEIEPAEIIPEYRLFIRQGENIAIHNLAEDLKDGKTIFEIEGGPWRPNPIDENSPMIHLARTAAVVPKDDCDGDLYGYWYAIANAIATLRTVDLGMEPDELVPREYDPDEYRGWYRVPEWLFEAYALALYPGMDVPAIGDYDLWVQYHPETAERWWVGAQACADHCEAAFKQAKQNPDGTWDVTFTVSYEYSGEIEEKIVRLAPNAAYDPDSPFEYHIVGWPKFEYGGDDWPVAPDAPPPEVVVGTWTGPVKRGHVAWLEIHADGLAGLYLGDDESDQLYEIYQGIVCPADDTDMDGMGVDYLMEMDFRLDWYVYESGDGTPVTGVPDSYRGLYTLRCEGEALYVTAGLDADRLFGKEALELFYTAKTLGGGGMIDIEAVG